MIFWGVRGVGLQNDAEPVDMASYGPHRPSVGQDWPQNHPSRIWGTFSFKGPHAALRLEYYKSVIGVHGPRTGYLKTVLDRGAPKNPL